jgi:hypothetical protein
MTAKTTDFVHIEFIDDRHCLGIYVHSDGLSPEMWVRIIRSMPTDEVLSGYDCVFAAPRSMAFDVDGFYVVRTRYARQDWIDKYNERQSKENAEDTTTV